MTSVANASVMSTDHTTTREHRENRSTSQKDLCKRPKAVQSIRHDSGPTNWPRRLAVLLYNCGRLAKVARPNKRCRQTGNLPTGATSCTVESILRLVRSDVYRECG